MSNTMEPDAFLDDLHALRPVEPDRAALVAAGYEAGRRDGAAMAGASVARWRFAAGVLLAATVGLAVVVVSPDPQREPMATVTPSAPAIEAEPARVAPRATDPIAPPRPESYASIRQHWSATGELVLPASNPQSGGQSAAGGPIPRVGDAL